MKGRTIAALLATAAILALLWAAGGAIASPPREGPRGEGGAVVASTVGEKINYQGQLTDPSTGDPLDGTYTMQFQLYTAETGGSPIWDSGVQSVQVANGLFKVELDVDQSDFDGQELWLRIGVGGEWLTPRQELLPVPYALSLRPGARIISSGYPALHAESTHPSGRGLRGYATATSGTNYGVVGASKSPDGYGGYFYNTANGGTGVYARGIDTGADLILGGNADTLVGDDGRIYSEPAYDSSDIYLIVNDGVRIDLDENGDGEDADFEIRDKDNNLIFNVDESGDITYGGPNIAAFPRPAYDSGWVDIAQDQTKTLTHNLGGDIDNYVVDLQFKDDGGFTINNIAYGGREAQGGKYWGASWSKLTSTTINVKRYANDVYTDKIRVRIWVYK